MSGEYLRNQGFGSEKRLGKDYLKKNKVDINILLNKVREEEKKEKFSNIILVSVVSAGIVLTGILISL